MLARLNARLNREEEGFTLIELLVVIIIIGILAAIAIPVFLSQRQKGYEASMKTDLRTVAQEVESQNVNNQDYTQTTFAGAVAVANAAITGSGQTVGDSTNIDLSAGNTITWIGSTTTSYCLMATTSKVATNPPVWYYSTTGGGMTKTPCTQ
jgi:prepilin-type N-terminal cleavage/methylation domain-containing protein